MAIAAGIVWSYFGGLPRMLRREEYRVHVRSGHGVQPEQVALTARWRTDWIHSAFVGMIVFSVAFAAYLYHLWSGSSLALLCLGIPSLLFSFGILCWLGWAPWRLGPVLLDPEKLTVPGLRNNHMFPRDRSRVWSRRLSRGLWACLVDNGVDQVLLMIDEESAIALRGWAFYNDPNLD